MFCLYNWVLYIIGVVLLDLLTGRKPVYAAGSSEMALLKFSEGKVNECVDSRLGGDYPPETVIKMAKVAAMCVQYEANSRPKMSIVVEALQLLMNA